MTNLRARDPICPRRSTNSFCRDSDPANSADKGLFRSLRTIQLDVALAQGRRLCGTIWVASNINVTQNCQQSNGETLMFRENPVGRKSGITLAKNYGPRTWKSLAVFVVAACAVIHGQSSPKQMADPAVAALGSGFVSDTAQVNGTTL